MGHTQILVVGGDVAYVDDEGRLAMLDEPFTESEMRSIIETPGVGHPGLLQHPAGQPLPLDR